MKNTIRLVKQEEIDEIKKYFIKKGDTALLIELRGKKLRNWQQYSTVIGKKLEFPDMYQNSKKEHVVDAYLDWIRDLSWFKEVEEFAIIIYDYNDFLFDEENNIRQGKYGKYVINKDMIIAGFVEIILPWWENDVERCVTNGKAKPFNVYLVE